MILSLFPLIQELYDRLVHEADSAEAEKVQDAFRAGIQHFQGMQQHKPSLITLGTCNSSEIKAALLCHDDWESHAETKNTRLVQDVQHVPPAGQDTLPSFSLHELEGYQLQGSGWYFVETRDPMSNNKRLQLVFPAGLGVRALEGVHDLAGHQG